MDGSTSSTGCSNRVYSQSRKAISCRKRRARLRTERGCWQCGKPLDTKGLLCALHADKNRMRMARLRLRGRFAGICHDCPEPAAPLRLCCAKHLAREAEMQRRYQRANPWVVKSSSNNINKRLFRDAQEVVELGWI